MITTEQKELILQSIEGGLNNKDACTLAGVSSEWFYKQRSDNDEWSEAIKKAKVKNKAFHIDKISNDKSWQSSAWYLERIYKDEYQIKKEEVKQPITIQWEEIKMKKAE